MITTVSGRARSSSDRPAKMYDTPSEQARQVRIRDLFGKDDHGRIVINVGAIPRDLALSIDHPLK